VFVATNRTTDIAASIKLVTDTTRLKSLNKGSVDSMNKIFCIATIILTLPSLAQAQYIGEFTGYRWDATVNAYREVTSQQPAHRPGQQATAVAFSRQSARRSTGAMGQQSGIVYQKSLMQAQRGRMGHVMRGQYLPSARAEGVGFSTRSAQDALRRCCYYGQRQMVGYSVVRGRRGWYATSQYR